MNFININNMRNIDFAKYKNPYYVQENFHDLANDLERMYNCTYHVTPLASCSNTRIN